jgi:nucleotide-binding universal stress UspA family protein
MNSPRWAAAHRPHLPHFQRILCAVDLARPSPGAFGFAALIAERFGASLEALYVGSAADEAQPERLERFVASSTPPVPATARTVDGNPARTILERAERTDTDLIVLGSRQRSDLGWQFRDDVVRDVSASASCATLTVHERDNHAVIEHILLPVDFGPATDVALAWASTFALLFGAKLQLLHVVSRERTAARSDDLTQLSALQRQLSARGIDASCQVTLAGGAAIGIESYNDQSEFDLIVMGVGEASKAPARLTRGVIATLRNRMPVPLLSVRATPLDATDPRRADAGHSGRGARAEISA